MRVAPNHGTGFKADWEELLQHRQGEIGIEPFVDFTLPVLK
jgi:hypothetical protein